MIRLGNMFNTNFDFDYIPLTTNLAGVSFDNRQDIVKNLQVNEFARLVRDLNNNYDKNAIKVIINNNHVGWIPKELATKLSSEIDAGLKWNGRVKKIVGVDDQTRGVVIEIFCESKEVED